LAGSEPATGRRHRVALELEVAQGPGEIDPEEWELDDLALALWTGQARPLRTIQGLVVDPENDRLSTTLSAMADDVDEASQLQWMAMATRWPSPTRTARSPRPSLDVLMDLEHLATAARLIARRLADQGL
jgi:hypothetical protein